jgi:hypothetical protein
MRVATVRGNAPLFFDRSLADAHVTSDAEIEQRNYCSLSEEPSWK